MSHSLLLHATLIAALTVSGICPAAAQETERTSPSRATAETQAQPAAEIREADVPVSNPSESAPHSGGPMERAGHAVDEAVEKTGKVVKKVVQKTKEGVKTVVDKTGRSVKKAGEKIQEAASPNRP